jgi:type II secretion system protein N
MTPRVKKWIAWAGYPLAYFCLLACFARATFPFDRLRDRIVGDFNAHQAPSSRLRIGDMSGYWLAGIEASNIELTQAPKSKSPTEPADAKPKVMTVDSAHVSLSLLRLLIGTTAVSFGAGAFGGELSGTIANGSNEQTYDFDLEKLDVGRVPFLDDLVGLPMKGTMAGQTELALADRLWAKSEGKVGFTIAGLKVGDGKAKVLNAIALPEISVGKVDFAASVMAGRLKIEKLAAKGSDLDLGVEGGIRLKDPLGTSMLDLTLKFRFSDTYRDKNDTTRALLGAPGSTSPALFELNPQVQRSKRADGYYGWRIGGTLDHPTFEPSATGGAGVSARGPAGPPAPAAAPAPAPPPPPGPAP